MKEIKISDSFTSCSYTGFVVFRRKEHRLAATGAVPDFRDNYQDVVIRYKDSIGIAKQGKDSKVRISKTKEKGKLIKLDILCGEFCWIDNEEELAKELI